MSFYQLLVLVHIFSAILGMGPGFVMLYIVTKATTMSEIRHTFVIRHRIHIFVMVGGTLLLVSGLLMGLINPVLFKQGWYVVSLLLFLLALAAGPIVLSPLTKPIKRIIRDHQGEDIPELYNKLSQKLFFYERVTNAIFFIIIGLMILKPF